MVSRQYSFDRPDEDDDEDEFMQYYRKFRPSASSSLRGSQTSSSSPIFSHSSDRSSLRHSTSASKLANKAIQLFRPKKRLFPKSRSLEEEQASTASSSNFGMSRTNSSNTSPLGGLTGLLSDKMTFSGASSGVGDDSHSRDSGHSSGGSPDLRGLRKRRSAPPPMQSRAFKNLYDRDWYRQSSRDQPPACLSSRFEDRQSLYSYTTAKDTSTLPEMPSHYPPSEPTYWPGPPSSCRSAHGSSIHSGYPAGAKLERPLTGIDESFSDVYPSSRNPSMYHGESPRAKSAHPDMCGYNKRKLDCLCEDSLQLSGSLPRAKRPCTPPQDHAQATDARANSPLRVWCSRLCFLLKTLTMGLSFCLMLFALFFVWRSYRCESDRLRDFDLEALTRALDDHLFGQGAAKGAIIDGIRQFSAQDLPVYVLILAGWVGSGKTHTSGIIAKQFPIPENIHSFTVPLHFAEGTSNFHFLDDLSLHISRSCGHSLVIFDDIDAGPAKTLDYIEKFIVTLKNSQLSSRSNGTLIIITSNVGGQALNQHTLSSMREDISSRDIMDAKSLAQVIEHSAHPVPTLQGLRSHSITVEVIPFLPLAREHVRQCVEHEIQLYGYPSSLPDIEKILAEIRFFTDDFPVLSKNGCKSVSSKVNLFLNGQDPYFHG